MLAAVIFDVDGTLLDTERVYIRAWKEAGKTFGYTIPDEVLEQTRGLSMEAEIPIFQAACGMDFPFLAVQKERGRLAEAWIPFEKNLIKPGAPEVLRFLKERRIPMAVASTTKRAKTVAHLEHAGLLPYFSALVCGDMVQHKKPHPESFLTAASLLSVDPKNCLVVEDSQAGVRAAYDAGCTVVLIPDHGLVDPDSAALADHVLASMHELRPLLPRYAE